MSKDDPLKNWQLEQGGEPLDQWKLQDAEQQIDKHMQLQPSAETPSDWQPVEYNRTATRSGRNWVLPSIVIVALLVALGYVGFVSLNRFGTGGFTLGPITLGAATETPTSEPTPATEAAAGVAPTATQTLEATPTLVPPTATPEPTPTPALITLRLASVSEAAGVNARRGPSTDSEIVRLLNNGEQTTVADTDGDWLQVILADNQVAWVSSEFMTIGVGDQVTLEEWNARRTALGLEPIAAEGEVAPAPDAEGTSTAPDVSVPVTVSADPGGSVRLEPAPEAELVSQVLLNTAVTATGRTAASDWLLVTLPDGARGWILASLVTATGDLTALPVQPALILVNGTPSVDISLDVTPTPATGSGYDLVVSPIIPAAPYTNTLPLGGPAIAISDTLGVNARTAPSLEGGVVGVVSNGAVLPVVGRSADDEWVQVTLPDSQRAWIFRSAVNVSSNIDSAPVVGEEAPAAATTPVATDGAATATINTLLGSNARPEPANDAEPLETLALGTALPVTARSADNLWLQVQLADGTAGWILADTADLTVDIATLPVAQ